MENVISSALLIMWVLAAWLLLSGKTGKPVWFLTGVAAAHIAYGGYLIFFAAAQGGTEL
ncbi:MAG: hypothetical protein ACPGRZ_13270 [Alphaproteobacteria bacterium]